MQPPPDGAARAERNTNTGGTGGPGALDALLDVIRARPGLLVLTGAGCSTGSGIPDYRDRAGEWKRTAPIHLPDFLASSSARQRYWARSMVGWPSFAKARPNAVHRALATLEARGHVLHTVTQNVDGLHQRAGATRVVDLHGRLDQARCLACDALHDRDDLQAELERRNPAWTYRAAQIAPDGDVDLEGADYTRFQVPTCQRCAGVLKPSVVFFGENVPKPRVAFAMACLEEAAALLVVGSSLMVFSGYRFVRAAQAAGKPVLIVNRGKTRGDGDATVKVDGDAGPSVQAIVTALGA